LSVASCAFPLGAQLLGLLAVEFAAAPWKCSIPKQQRDKLLL
jgi:hypothetical protein